MAEAVAAIATEEAEVEAEEDDEEADGVGFICALHMASIASSASASLWETTGVRADDRTIRPLLLGLPEATDREVAAAGAVDAALAAAVRDEEDEDAEEFEASEPATVAAASSSICWMSTM